MFGNAPRTCAARQRTDASAKGRELVVTDPRLGEFAADKTFTLELLELLHAPEFNLVKSAPPDTGECARAQADRAGEGSIG